MSSTLVGIIVVGAIFTIGFTVFFLKMFLQGRGEAEVKEVSKEIFCPGCKDNFTETLKKALKASINPEVVHRCKKCSTTSRWNVSGFPPSLIEHSRPESKTAVGE